MKALQHAYPMWEPPEDDPTAPPEDFHQVWHGKMRIVRSRKRRRALQRRGVPMLHLGRGPKGPGPWAWFIEPPLELVTVDAETAKQMQDEFREKHPDVIASWNRHRSQ